MLHLAPQMIVLARSLRDNGGFIALGLYTVAMAAGWVAFAASFSSGV